MNKDEFYRNWLKTFAAGISTDDLEKYVVSTGNLIWHIFSWELLDKSRYLSGDQAKTAYNEVCKQDAMYLNWFSDDETQNIDVHTNSAEALDGMYEVYAAAKDFSWTYIKTHETMCGPYFMKNL